MPENETQDSTPSLDGVEIISEGEPISTTDEDNITEVADAETDDESTEETKETTEEEEEAEEVPAEQKDLETAKDEVEQAKTELSSKNIDYSKLEDEYNNNGELSAESYKQLEGAGYPKAMVDAIIAGWQAKADAFVNKVIESAGGKKEYQRIAKFVQEQGKAATEAFDEIVQKSNLNLTLNYIQGIKAQMIAKYGTTNKTMAGSTEVVDTKGFTSEEQMIKAISDPRYETDAKYRRDVERKIERATFF